MMQQTKDVTELEWSLYWELLALEEKITRPKSPNADE